MSLTIFVLAHYPEVVDIVPSYSCYVPINLNDLDIGVYQSNQLAESRMYFTDIPEKSGSRYVGFVTAKWNRKFDDLYRLNHLRLLSLESEILWTPFPTCSGWSDRAERFHSGMGVYLQELSDMSGLELNKENGVLTNNFICEIGVYLVFKKFFHKMFNHFHTKYGYDMKYSTNDKRRHAAFFYEAITALYFSNQMSICVKQVPKLEDLCKYL